MKRFKSLSDAKSFVKLFLQGTFPESSFILSDLKIDYRTLIKSHVIRHPYFLGVRKNGTAGIWWSCGAAIDYLYRYEDPFVIIEFNYEPESKFFTVRTIPCKK